MTQRVLQEAADWVWVPAHAEDYTGPDYRLTVYPDRTSVQWSATTRPLAEVITEVRARARAAGRPALRWWVNGRTAPPDTAMVLEEHGFRPVEVVEVLARDLADVDDLGAALALPDDVVVCPADDADTIRACIRDRGAGCGGPRCPCRFPRRAVALRR